MHESMKPPFSYYGGKQRMAPKIIPYIQKHTVYVEPFCGSATIMFKKPWPDVTVQGHYREIINDRNELVVNFFKQLATNGDALAEQLSVTPYSEAVYAASKQAKDIEDDLQRAVAFYVNIRQSFASIMNGGWGRGVFSQSCAARWENSCAALFDYIKRMRAVHICNQDAVKLIEQWDSPQSFFYCDPPYVNTNQGHYGGYTQEDFDRLVETLSNGQGSAMVSTYEQDASFARFPGVWRKASFSAYCTASGKGKVEADRSKKMDSADMGDRKRTEVIYVRRSVKPREEILKLYRTGKYDCFTGAEMWKDMEEVR